jgi:energy-coupling factor transport system ATP-binding protein
MNPIISFKDFTFQYNAQSEPTLHSIDLDIYPGEKILIVGPSGSGKSTLGNCLNGLIPNSYPGKYTGDLTIDGISIKDSDIFELSKHIGTVLQDPDGQFVGMTVGEDIAFALENDCVPTPEMHDIVRRQAAVVGIADHLDYAPYDLSGGQKQRDSLAGVLVDKVKILLFDEPLANLDPATGKSTIELIDRIQKETDTTVIIIEHRLEDVLWRHVDRIVLISEGTIKADMKPDDLLAGDLLTASGIREPLYLTALRYAGVPITPQLKPSSIATLALDEDQKRQVRNWYTSVPQPQRQADQPVLLAVQDLCFSYRPGVEILHDISFTIRKGELVAIVGQNGAGKSTLAKNICGFESPDSGTIRYQGEDITRQNIRTRATQIGYVMQNPNQMISKTMIWDEVALGLQKQELSEEEITKRVEDTLKICGLYPFRHWPISALSFGQKKRVTIASILVMGPKLIILDEPTAGQDYYHYTEIMEFLKSLNDQGVTVIMITHDMHLMLEYADRALVFTDGRLIADESCAAVLCDDGLVAKSDLKKTSLFDLALDCGIDDPVSFTDCFIRTDRRCRADGR